MPQQTCVCIKINKLKQQSKATQLLFAECGQLLCCAYCRRRFLDLIIPKRYQEHNDRERCPHLCWPHHSQPVIRGGRGCQEVKSRVCSLPYLLLLALTRRRTVEHQCHEIMMLLSGASFQLCSLRRQPSTAAMAAG